MYEIINNVPLKVKEYKGQRVVTFKDIDRVHNRPEGTARRNFNKNREYFIEGEDFFTIELTTNEIRTQFGAGKHAGKTLTLITEYGYMMLVKSFTDKLAWDVQRQLVNTYFRAKEINNSHDERIYEKLEMLEQKINVLDKKTDVLEQEINMLEKKIDMLENNSDNRMNKIINSADKTASDAIKTLNPCFYALDDKIESVADTIIRAVSGNVKLLAVYINYLLKMLK